MNAEECAEFSIASFLSCMVHIHLFPQVIEMNRRVAERQAQTLLKDLQEEINELKKRSTALSQLALSEDYIHFLKVWMNEVEN